MSKTVADHLSVEIVGRATFQEEYEQLEYSVAEKFLSDTTSWPLKGKTVENLLRYADILSHSSVGEYRQLAYSIVALLMEYEAEVGLNSSLAAEVFTVAEAVMLEVGNFPGLEMLDASGREMYALPPTRGLAGIAKQVLQSTHKKDGTFTDVQYEIVDMMRDQDYFSFSGPTSLGKSYILKDMIYDISRKSELNGRCIVVLVPTKALIAQTASDLRMALRDIAEINVVTHPSLPGYLRNRFSRTVFVFTPERLIRYLANPVREVAYLIVDEAQKVIAEGDARSSLYYHSIVETTRRYATKLLFASPSIANPELFLTLFGKSKAGALAVKERSVFQNRYFIDLVKREQYYVAGVNSITSSNSILRRIEGTSVESDLVELILKLSRTHKAIIYVNSSKESVDFALQLAARCRQVDDTGINELIKFVHEYVHEDYYLAHALRHGLAFHHGKMPLEIRDRIEKAFADPNCPIRFIVCTSTLLEGVNLPAKSIFVLSDRHGRKSFLPKQRHAKAAAKVDFENLVGRAGRLSYDFVGNVICIRTKSKSWSEEPGELIAAGEPQVARSFLVDPPKRQKRAYTDIARILAGDKLPNGRSEAERRNAEQFATILTLHELDNQESPLRSHFLQRVNNGRQLLDSAVSRVRVPVDVLRRSPTIRPEYQNKVWLSLKCENPEALVQRGADIADFNTLYAALRRLSDLYDWRTGEVSGADALMSNVRDEGSWERRLKYWALLMRGWVRGDPLSRVIARAIQHHVAVGHIVVPDYSDGFSFKTEIFDASNIRQVNFVIDEVMKDVETGIRFRILRYLQNYFDLSLCALGFERTGINLALAVEYGTIDVRAIELQDLGFGRSVALELLNNYSDALEFQKGGDLCSFDYETVLESAMLSNEARIEIRSIVTKE